MANWRIRQAQEDLEATYEVWGPVAENLDLGLPDTEQMLGCGNFGCAFGTTKENQVFKVTSNRNEAELMAIQKQTGVMGLVSVQHVLEISYREFMIWRDRLDMCCIEALRSLREELGLPKSIIGLWDTALREYANTQPDQVQEFCEYMSELPGLRDIGNGMFDLAEQNIQLDDLHDKNIGRFMNHDQLIIFDAEASTLDGSELPDVIGV